MKSNKNVVAAVSAQSDSDWQTIFVGQFLMGYSSNTHKAIQQDLSVFLDWFLAENGEEFTPEKLTNWDMHAFRRYQVDVCRVAAATWNRRMSTMRKLAEFCQKGGFVSVDVFDGIQAMDQQDNQPRWMDNLDFARLMRQVERNVNAARSPMQRMNALRDQAMVGLMAYAGLREFEVVDLHRGDVVIRERSGYALIHAGKGEKERMVPLGKEARRLVNPWLQEAMGGQLFSISERWIQKRIKALGQQAGCLEDITPHRLRHSFGKRMVDKGVSIEKVAMLLGHSSIETTKIYVRPGFQDLADAVEMV